MRLSIVINNYNYAGFLREAVDSALAQSHDDLEVVVVDDGSTDGSADVLAGLPDTVHVVQQANGGQASAFNTGLARSTGDVVIFLDSDDRLHADVGERVVACMARDEHVVRVQYPLRVVDAAGAATGSTRPSPPVRLVEGDVARALAGHPDDVPWQPTSGNAWRRAALERVMPVPVDDYRICADYYLSNTVPWLGTVAALPQPGGDYRVHGSNNEHGDFDLGRLRANIVRTAATHRHTRPVAQAAAGVALPADPLASGSVTFLANRLVSLRLAPGAHPFPEDRRARLAVQGVRAALGRDDLPLPGRLARALWFGALASCPGRLVPRVLAPYLDAGSAAAGTQPVGAGTP